MSRVVAISNRVSLPRRGTAPGGLAVGVLAAMRAHGGAWVGWSGQVAEAPVGVQRTRRHGLSFVTFDLSRSEYEQFYLGFSNAVLWPLFHYFLEAFHYSAQHYETWLAVNRRFAAHTLEALLPDDLLWVHDYQLLALGSCLRSFGVAQPIGFFLHIPFPGFEVFRALPVFEELLEGLLAYDLLGFQTENDLRSFRSAAAAVWGEPAVESAGVRVGERYVATGVFPIGVDVDDIGRTAAAAQATEACRRMASGLLGRRLIIGVDRLDYSKGLVERFHAYERFLASHPEHRNGVTFLQIAPLSRTDVGAYELIRQALEQAAGRTNGRFADTDWTPIRYLNRNVPHATLMGYLRAARVALVTPVRDGMNLVAKEFVAAQDPADPGVLVLSCLAGAARELTTAVQVNPYDEQAVADALQAALSMPLAERRERHEVMLGVLRAHDIHAWHRGFIARLCEVSRQRGLVVPAVSAG
jgi:trehalose 6-phosphate synthase